MEEPNVVNDSNGLTSTGEFTIEAYQRGYRWGKDEVEHLLEDINEIPDGQKYGLQPIVVKNVNGVYELVEDLFL